MLMDFFHQIHLGGDVGNELLHVGRGNGKGCPLLKLCAVVFGQGGVMVGHGQLALGRKNHAHSGLASGGVFLIKSASGFALKPIRLARGGGRFGVF